MFDNIKKNYLGSAWVNSTGKSYYANVKGKHFWPLRQNEIPKLSFLQEHGKLTII